MPWGFCGSIVDPAPPRPARIGRPDRGSRATVKAGRKAARRSR